ncbi:putative phosphite transport system-binding protein PtxB isoform X2 [Oratosquilla oratoria]
MNNSDKNLLCLGTYVCPSLPVEYYEFLGRYLDAELGIHSILVYDSMRQGPDVARGDDKHIDIAFVRTNHYLREYHNNSKSSFELLPVAPVFQHPTKGKVQGYYTDILVHRDTIKRIKDFIDLRGSKFAYANRDSVSSSHLLLTTLKQLGENTNFFSNMQVAETHPKSIELILLKKADVAAVDSISLKNYLTRYYYQEEELHVLESWGPLPPHPILINKSLPDELKQKTIKALLSLHKYPNWQEGLNNFGFLQFEPLVADKYLEVQSLLNSTRRLSLDSTYY